MSALSTAWFAAWNVLNTFNVKNENFVKHFS